MGITSTKVNLETSDASQDQRQQSRGDSLSARPSQADKGFLTNTQIQKQVEVQERLIANRIRRLNQERDKTLNIIEKTIEQTYRFKSVQRERQERLFVVQESKAAKAALAAEARRKQLEEKVAQQQGRKERREAMLQDRRAQKVNLKTQHEEQAQLAKADQELEREWVRTKAANQKARAQYLRLQREAKQEAAKAAGDAARKQQEVTARIE